MCLGFIHLGVSVLAFLLVCCHCEYSDGKQQLSSGLNGMDTAREQFLFSDKETNADLEDLDSFFDLLQSSKLRAQGGKFVKQAQKVVKPSVKIRGLRRVSTPAGIKHAEQESLNRELLVRLKRDSNRGVVRAQGWGSIGRFFRKVKRRIVHTAKKVYHGVHKAAKKVVRVVKKGAKKAYHAIKHVGKTAVHVIKKGVHTVTKFGKRAWKTVKRVSKSVIHHIKKTSKRIWNKMKRFGKGMLKKFKTFAVVAWKKLKHVGKLLWKGLEVIGEYVEKFVKSPIGRILIEGALEMLDVPPFVSGPLLTLMTGGSPIDALTSMIPGGKVMKTEGRLLGMAKKGGLFKKAASFIEKGGMKKVMGALFRKGGVKKALAGAMKRFGKGELKKLGKVGTRGILKKYFPKKAIARMVKQLTDKKRLMKIGKKMGKKIFKEVTKEPSQKPARHETQGRPRKRRPRSRRWQRRRPRSRRQRRRRPQSRRQRRTRPRSRRQRRRRPRSHRQLIGRRPIVNNSIIVCGTACNRSNNEGN